MEQNGVLVEFREVHKRFEGNLVLRGVDMDIERGKVTTILGPSGCGKSVTLKHIIGILKADSGTVTVAGHDMGLIRSEELLALRKRIGVLFQSSALFDSMSVKENVAFGLRMHTLMSEAEIEDRVAECLEEVDLPGAEDVMPVDLSGGMRKRAALARAISLSPDLILYDEPTTGLDPKTANVVGDLILKLQSDLNITSIVVTHDLPLTRRVSDNVALLYEGKTAVQGPTSDVEQSGNEVFEMFVSGHL